MISQTERQDERPLLATVHLLLQALAEHVIEGDPDDLAQFRRSIRGLDDALNGGMAPVKLVEEIGEPVRALEEYSRRTARYLKRHVGEWQAVVTMLTSAIAAKALPGEENIRRLREIAARVRTANNGDEAHKIRLQFAECVTEIQLEQRHQNAAPAEAVAQHGGDPVSGLLPRPEAEKALALAWQTEPPSYVLVAVLDRLQIFNMRFGHKVGDEVFRYFAKFLHGQLRTGDQVFHWSGPTLVVLMSRPARLEIVRDEVARMMDARCEHTVRTESRTILLPIAARWVVFPSMAAPRLLIHKIDAFAARKADQPVEG